MEPASQPPRATLISWLKLNLALTMFAISMVSALCGGLVTATWNVATARFHIDTMTEENKRLADRVKVLETSMVDVDHRFNENTAHIADLRQVRDAELSGIYQRIGVLETQVKFFGGKLMGVRQ